MESKRKKEEKKKKAQLTQAGRKRPLNRKREEMMKERKMKQKRGTEKENHTGHPRNFETEGIQEISKIKTLKGIVRIIVTWGITSRF